MNLFPCPFCGPREETEFHYAGEPGNTRPEGADIPAGAWADYVFMRSNAKGASREIWMHLTCGELFVMRRDTATHEVLGSETLAETEGEP